MSVVLRFFHHYCKLLELLIAAGLAVMVLLVFGNVVLRYAFNSGISVSEELSRWIFIWVTFMGAVVALHEHRHLGTEIFISRLSPTGKKVCLVLGYGLMLLICWMLFNGSLEQTRINWDTQAPSSGASLGWFYGVGVVFSVSAGAILLSDLARLLMGDAPLSIVKESEDEA